MYIGTYTKAPSKGIYAYRFKESTGEVTPLGTAGLAAETENPSFVAVHPNQRFLYAVNEKAAGSVSAFSIDRATGTLTLLNRVSISRQRIRVTSRSISRANGCSWPTTAAAASPPSRCMTMARWVRRRRSFSTPARA